MRYNFEQTEDDFEKFNFYFNWRQPDKKYYRLGFSIFPIAFYLVLIIIDDDGFVVNAGNIFMICLGGIIGLFMGRIFKWGTKRKTRALLKKGKNKNLIGEREIHLLEDIITIQASHANSEVRWDSLEKVGEDIDNVYLFVATNQALILPKRIFTDLNEEKNVMKFIKSKTGNNN